MPFETDITIIGAGIIGLGIAAHVASGKREVYVLEKNETFGQETSSRNSEVIHAGIYYPEGSLKARMCTEGNAMLYELCEKYGIGYKRLGKIIVAADETELSDLQMLFKRGKRNGAAGLRMLSAKELKELEPNVKGVAAILSPSTGILDSYALMKYFIGRAKDGGAEIAYKSRVVGIEKVGSGYKVTMEDGFSFKTLVLINSAGLQSDRVAKLIGIDISEAGYKLHYGKGEYFSVGHGKNKLVKRLIYPVPPRGECVGIHVTLDLEGRMRLGPNLRYVDRIDYTVDDSQKQAFYDSAIRLLPSIGYNDLEPEMAGIRARLQQPGEDFRDFVIRHEHDRGLPGFINLIGIDSPGLTASPAIASYVGDIVDEML
jgi:L-2-hydroxyglutarate oxidase LhgO